MEEAYLGVDIGSISTKGVIIDKNYKILASEYIWTEGDPMGAARKLIRSFWRSSLTKRNIRSWQQVRQAVPESW